MKTTVRGPNTERIVRNEIHSTGGRFFSVTFRKRTNGEIRTMNCRTMVTPEDRQKEDEEHGLLTVYDVQKHGYRRIPFDSVKSIRFKGETEFYKSDDV